jgi:hypothetical protein
MAMIVTSPRRATIPRLLSRATAIVVALLLAGCATMSVGTFVATPFEAARYFTYDWGPRDALPTGDARLDNNHVFQDYVTGAIDRGLAAKGLVRRESDAPPDLLVHYHATVRQRTIVHDASLQDTSYPPHDRAPQVEQFEAGTLIVDLMDARTNKLVWRGWAEDALDGMLHSQEQMRRHVNASIARMFTRLPIGQH